MPRSFSSPAWITRLAKGCPPGLLSVASTLQAYPNKALPILEREIEHRREFVLLAEQAHNFVLLRLGDALQGFIIMSVLILSALWTFRGLARIREWMQSLDPAKLPGGEVMIDQWRTVIVGSPLASWRWEFLAVIVVALIVGLFARHLGVLLFSLRQLKPLRHAAHSRETEIAILETWMDAAKDARK